MISKLTLPSLVATSLLVACLGTSRSHAAVTILDFSGSQYADNFTETSNANNMTVVGGILETTTSNGSISGITVYNSPVTAQNTDNFSLKIDANFDVMPSSLGGTSVSFLTNISGGAGYLAVFRLNTTGGVSSADFRLFEGATTNGSTVGVQVGSTQTLNAAALNSVTFNSSSFYTLNLDVTVSSSTSIIFAGSILDSSNSSIVGTFASVTDSSATLGGTAVALRLGAGGNNVTTSVDNFTITPASAIPEPSTAALLGGLSVLTLAAAKRRRR